MAWTASFFAVSLFQIVMSPSRSFFRFNHAHAILVLGLAVALLVVMFRPAGANADLPKITNVFAKWNDSDPFEVKNSSLNPITSDYRVVPKNKKDAVTSSLTGVPLVEFLKSAGADTTDVNFVRVSFDFEKASRLVIVPLYPDKTERPPMILSSGKVGSRSLGTPALVPGQPDSGTPIKQEQILAFDRSKPNVKIRPGKPKAQVLKIELEKKKLKSGQLKLTPKIVKGGSGNSAKYEWFQTDANGNDAKVSTSKTFTTNATGTKDVAVTVVVTEAGTESIGSARTTYIPKSSGSGSTKNPGGSTGSTGTGGNPTGTGTGTQPGGSITPLPTPVNPNSNSTPQQINPTTPQTPVTPTTPTQPAPASMDTTAITNEAQNVSGTGSLQTVSGVLLAAPTVSPASAGGSGAPLGALPAPVVDQLNSIFQPVESSEDLWAYLLAILFAFSISGAVREWVKP